MFITSNATDETVWHAGVARHVYGPRTGKLLRTYYVTACSGRTLGGAFGQTEVTSLPSAAVRDSHCRRCFPNNFDTKTGASS